MCLRAAQDTWKITKENFLHWRESKHDSSVVQPLANSLHRIIIPASTRRTGTTSSYYAPILGLTKYTLFLWRRIGKKTIAAWLSQTCVEEMLLLNWTRLNYGDTAFIYSAGNIPAPYSRKTKLMTFMVEPCIFRSIDCLLPTNALDVNFI
jgi:hypothetical protein